MGIYSRSFGGGSRGSHALPGNMADMEGKGRSVTTDLAVFPPVASFAASEILGRGAGVGARALR